MWDILAGLNVTELLQSTIRMTAPFLLAAIGGLISDTVGVSSIELEADLLIGAFAAYVGVYYTGSLVTGIAAAILAGLLLNWIYAYLVVGLGANGPLVATALVLFSIGFTNFFFRALFGVSLDIMTVPSLQALSIPPLSDIPVLGPILFRQNPLVYVSFLLVFATWFFLQKTALGLEWKAVGENPDAADTAGIPVRKYRYAGVLITGMAAALAGAYLSIAASNLFVERMSSEKGYAAFAIIILGGYSPVGVMLGCLLYGFADSLQLNLQALGVDIPNQFLLMLPYMVTVIVMAIAGRGKRPAGHGQYFEKRTTS